RWCWRYRKGCGCWKPTRAPVPASCGWMSSSGCIYGWSTTMIELFPSYLEGPPLATYRTQKRMTIDAWLLANMDTYASRDPATTGRLVVLLNGEPVPPAAWADIEFGPDDHVRMHPAPGGGAGKALGSIVSAAFKVMDVLSLGLLDRKSTRLNSSHVKIS